MQKDRWRWLALILLVTAPLSAERADAAGGAFVVDDTSIGKPGECKVESWASFATNQDFNAVTSPACVVQFGLPVELGTQFQRQRSDTVWSTAAGAKGKINILPAENGRLGVGLSGIATWDTATGAFTGNFINVPLTYEPSKKLRFNLNSGWQYDALTKNHYVSWGAGFEWGFADNLTLIGEVYGLAGQSIPGKVVTEPRAQIGLRLTPFDRVDLDLIYGRNIAGENAHWITVGLNLRF